MDDDFLGPDDVDDRIIEEVAENFDVEVGDVVAGLHGHPDNRADFPWQQAAKEARRRQRRLSKKIRFFRVLRDEDRTRIDVDGEVLGWGVQFPSGACHVDWNRQVYPPEDRLDHPHISQYGSFDDVEQGTGGAVEVLEVFGVPR
jgi:hypothetical protein